MVFKKGSCTTQLLGCLYDLTAIMDDGLETICIGFSKAFDTVPQKGLIYIYEKKME